jgi:hypothetical protein
LIRGFFEKDNFSPVVRTDGIEVVGLAKNIAISQYGVISDLFLVFDIGKFNPPKCEIGIIKTGPGFKYYSTY